MTVNEQFISIIIMVISGILIGAAIDGTRLFLDYLNPKSIFKKFAYGVELVVWALLGAGTFYILFLVKGGEWRLVDPLAQVSGIFLYESIFQPFFRFVGRVFVFLFINPIILIIRFIFKTLRVIIRLLTSIILILMKPFYKLYIILKKQFHKFYTKFRRTIFKKR